MMKNSIQLVAISTFLFLSTSVVGQDPKISKIMGDKFYKSEIKNGDTVIDELWLMDSDICMYKHSFASKMFPKPSVTQERVCKMECVKPETSNDCKKCNEDSCKGFFFAKEIKNAFNLGPSDLCSKASALINIYDREDHRLIWLDENCVCYKETTEKEKGMVVSVSREFSTDCDSLKYKVFPESYQRGIVSDIYHGKKRAQGLKGSSGPAGIKAPTAN